MYRLVILNYNDKIYFWHLYMTRLILISSFVFNLHVAMTLMYIHVSTQHNG